MGALLLLYLTFTVFYAVQLITAPQPLAQVIGWALLALPLLGAVFAVAEFVFGFRTERLGRRLEADGGLPADELPTRVSGRVERAAADEVFARYAAEAEANPGSWAHWFRLSLAYDGARDRRRARWAMREAIRLARADGIL
ncbi:hypothetical protein ASG83_00260 [Yonghaparkia sp. Soil809]|nr:hypothetical protein ASC54_07500 [Yonghaparkia sp. Root332]KRF32541.1 hypothetical protein ASG83_00260 [Yonghaparkia sp. Soil809]